MTSSTGGSRLARGQPWRDGSGCDGVDSIHDSTGPVETTGDATLVDVLDRLLSTGVVLEGEVVISVADVDLLYLGLSLVLSSVESLRRSARNN